jgi:hypothetical protein
VAGRPKAGPRSRTGVTGGRPIERPDTWLEVPELKVPEVKVPGLEGPENDRWYERERRA